jgi:hypothetical protein
MVESAILFGVYAFVLLFVMRQKPIYVSLLQETGLLRRQSSTPLIAPRQTLNKTPV